jgi:hypothetical protein
LSDEGAERKANVTEFLRFDYTNTTTAASGE